MTLLNWELTERSVLIFSDTLVIEGQSMLPGYFSTKVRLLPHLNMIVAGTGHQAVVSDFDVSVNESLVVRDIDHLSEFAPRMLQAIWQSARPLVQTIGGTSTIYTFGLSLSTSQMTGYAYRSMNNFVPEKLGVGRAGKPSDGVAGLIEKIGTIEDFVGMAMEQQTVDRAKKRTDRVGIGGELWAYALEVKHNPLSTAFSVQKLCDFPHRDADFELMIDRLPANAQNPESKARVEAALKT